MVARITIPQSIKKALSYNEQKVASGRADCLYAHGFLKEAAALHFGEKQSRFEDLIALNKRAQTNTVHISLNFAASEEIDRQKRIHIATTYMQKIGFAGQPYLVYEHLDAGHPHLHIVTTNIQSNGKRISLHNLGKIQSEKARKELEQLFHLVTAEDQKEAITHDTASIHIQRIEYGKSPTKRAITRVLEAVLPHYKYTSLAALNAVLHRYRVVADRGKKGSAIFRNHGLVYRVLDHRGVPVGIPIKASSIYNRPTLTFLEKRFAENERQKQSFLKSLKTTLDWVLLKQPKNLLSLAQLLEKEKINLLIRQNEQGIIYGLTYIDQNTKCVFNGSEIGKAYGAKAILEQCPPTPYSPVETMCKGLQISRPAATERTLHLSKHTGIRQSLAELMKPQQPEAATLADGFIKAKRKKRKSL